MPQATLRFKLPEEQEEFETSLHGGDYKLVLWDLDQALRTKYKYENQENIPIEEVRKMIYELLNERNLSI